MRIGTTCLRFVGILLLACACAPCGAGARRPLSVALFPFIPDGGDFFARIEQGFEAEHPDIDLRIIDLSDNYYIPTMPKSITGTQADVYELDTVFLQDFVSANRIQPLPAELIPADGEVLGNARSASMLGGVWFAAPHWVCGNFLFYLAGDVALANAATLTDLKNAVAPDDGILSDLVGTNLGEYYLDVLNDRYGDPSAFTPYLTAATLDPGAIADLEEVLNLCPAGYCRSEAYHEEEGFYPRRFARGAARAYVGYSESLYDVILEIQSSCSADDGCIAIDEVAAGVLPFDDNGRHQFSWVDSMAIDAGCAGPCGRDAIAFIAFYNDEETTLAALLPDGERPVRYLLPARASLYDDAELLEAAPLYPAFRAMIEGAPTITGDGLMNNMVEIDERLDALLPDHAEGG